MLYTYCEFPVSVNILEYCQFYQELCVKRVLCHINGYPMLNVKTYNKTFVFSYQQKKKKKCQNRSMWVFVCEWAFLLQNSIFYSHFFIFLHNVLKANKDEVNGCMNGNDGKLLMLLLLR